MEQKLLVSYQESESSIELRDLDIEVDYEEPAENQLFLGTFILAKFASGRRKCSTFKYVCKVLEKLPDSEYNIVGFKSSNFEKTRFRIVEDDESVVTFTDIVAILPLPLQINEHEYEFSGKVDVTEVSKSPRTGG